MCVWPQVASWYGQKDVGLRLGTAFHRSHLELVASQVSEITGAHARRWSKARRFAAAWDLLRRVRPSTRLPVLKYTLDQAADAYRLLDEGAAGAAIVQFVYGAGGESDQGALRARF